MTKPALPNNRTGWLLYDGHCGFCSWWVPFWENTLNSVGLEIERLQAPWVSHEMKIPQETIDQNLRILLQDGTQIEAAEVYRFVMKRLWWAYPFYLLSILPGFSWLFDFCYRSFANNRHKISRACRIPPPEGQ